MNINPDEIKDIKSIGSLHDEDVKMVVTKGGLYLVLGRSSKNKKSHEALAAGSHPALVIHQIEKQFKKDFHPLINKSETEQLPEVKELDCNINGLSMFSLSKNSNTDIVITKFGIEMCKCACEIEGENLKIKRIDYRPGFNDQMKDSLRTELNKGVIQIAEIKGICNFIK